MDGDAYSVLHLQQDASTITDQVVRKAFHQRAKQTHPDKTPGKTSHAQFETVKNAYEQLATHQARTKYNAQLAAAAHKTNNHSHLTEDVELSEWDIDTDTLGQILFTYACRCGSLYELNQELLRERPDWIECQGCSLSVRPIYNDVVPT